MSRKHLFAIVVLLGAAATAGLLALTRTTTAAMQPSSTQIAAKSRALDRLEASLRRSLAEQPPVLPPARQATDPSARRTVFLRSSAAPQAPIGEREDEPGDEGDRAYEQENEHEGADD
jgi:hypothetical protein